MSIKLYELTGKDKNIMFSPFCWRTRMSVLHKGLDFELIPWYFSDKSTTQEAGFEKVPSINDNGTWKTDSFAIAQYLDDTYPDKPSLIGGSQGKAQYELVNSIINNQVFLAAVSLAIYQVYSLLGDDCQAYFKETREQFFGKPLQEVQAEPEQAKANLIAALSVFDATLSNTPFLGGDSPLYADYTLFGILKWLDIVSSYDPIPHDTPTGKWFAKVSDLFDGYAAKAKTVRA